MSNVLNDFKSYLKQISLYEQVISLIEWDLQTATPEKGVHAKTEALSHFSTEHFRMTTSKEYGQMLETLSQPEAFDTLDDVMKLTVKRYKRDYEKQQRIPESFYSEFVKTRALSQKAWEKAKKNNDFASYLPHLDKVISMVKEQLSYTDPGEEMYDALLDQYEEGVTCDQIEKVFDELKEGLVPLLKKIAANPRPDLSNARGFFSVDDQKKVQEMLLEYIGFDFDAGTTAISAHPFTMDMAAGDCRVTNHYNEDWAISAMFSAIHEGGHAIFGQSINPQYEYTAAAQVNLMGLHESQSRFFENILGRNKNFWIPIYDKLGEILPTFKNVSLDEFYRIINDVQPRFIRMESDELSYCLHIILRFEMEKAIFKDGVATKDLPELWNKKTEELLGITPETDTKGILQDVHWSDGAFGYFPSYLLGSIYDGMFLQVIEKDMGSLDVILAEGRIKEITKWLQGHIHQYGSQYISKEIMERLGAGELSAKPLLDYFYNKYSKIYNLE